MRPRPVHLCRSLALALLMLCTASAVIYNSRADDLARDLLSGLVLTEGATRGCDSVTKYLTEQSFPNVVSDKELVWTASYVTALPLSEVVSRVTQNARTVTALSPEWRNGTGFAHNFYLLRSLPGYTVPIYLLDNADSAGHTAVCSGIFKDQSAP